MKLDRVIAVRNSKTIYRDGDKCIKVFSEDYSKADVLNEALNQARIEETGKCKSFGSKRTNHIRKCMLFI